MSTRSTRASTASAVSERPSSPLSQTLYSRKQEKKELANLNDRLAQYIDRNRLLEAENSQLVTECKIARESIEREVQKSKAVYEKELKDLRFLLDDTAKGKAKIELENQRVRAENDDLNSKMKQKLKELNAATKKAESLEKDLENWRSQYNTLTLDKKNLENQINSINQDVASLQKQLKNVQAQLEAETLSRVNMENQVHSLREELDFKEAIHKQEILDVRKTSEQQLSSTLSSTQDEYLQRLDDELSDLRERYETQQKLAREEMEHNFNSQLCELQKLLDAKTATEAAVRKENHNLKSSADSLNSKIAELKSLNSTLTCRTKDLEKRLDGKSSGEAALRSESKSLKSTVDSLNSKVAELKSLNSTLSNRISDLEQLLDVRTASEAALASEVQALKTSMDGLNCKISELKSLNSTLTNRTKDLEKLLSQERSWSQTALKEKDDEINKVRAEINQVHKEYQDLMDVKVALDFEINTYRKLLEGEETRLSPKDDGSRVTSPRAYATPRRRKRVYLQDEDTYIDIKVTSDCKGDVEISGYDQDGKYIKLTNKGDEDVPLSGWVLTKTAGDRSVTYKFPRTASIKAKAEITLWSANQKDSATGTDIVIKSNWVPGDDACAALVNHNGEEIATRTTTKTTTTRGAKMRRTAGLNDFDYDSESSKKQECSLM